MEVIFETPRLRLRRFTLADAALVYQLNSHPQVLEYVHEPRLNSEAAAMDILKRIILPQYDYQLGRWAVHLKQNEAFIGWCGLKKQEADGAIDLGYRFIPESWGKGYATEAAINTLAYGFGYLALPQVVATAHALNTASIRVLQKAGMHWISDGVEDGFPVKNFRSINSGTTRPGEGPGITT